MTKIAGRLCHSPFLKSDGSLHDMDCGANGELGCIPLQTLKLKPDQK